MFVQFFGYLYVFVQEVQYWVVFEVGFFFVFVEQYFYVVEQQEGVEYVYDLVEFFYQCGVQVDYDCLQDDGVEDVLEQYLVLVVVGDVEEIEDYCYDEYVVY